MPDVPPPLTAGETLLGGALQPRRFGTVIVAIRRLAWPILRGWLLPLSAELDRVRGRMEAEAAISAAMHQELTAARAEIAALQARWHELSDQVAQNGHRGQAEIAAVRSELSAARDNATEILQREMLALGNVVTHYRRLVDSALPEDEVPKIPRP